MLLGALSCHFSFRCDNTIGQLNRPIETWKEQFFKVPALLVTSPQEFESTQKILRLCPGLCPPEALLSHTSISAATASQRIKLCKTSSIGSILFMVLT